MTIPACVFACLSQDAASGMLVYLVVVERSCGGSPDDGVSFALGSQSNAHMWFGCGHPNPTKALHVALASSRKLGAQVSGSGGLTVCLFSCR